MNEFRDISEALRGGPDTPLESYRHAHDREGLLRAYQKWIGESEFGWHTCFVDITYFGLLQREQPFTLIIAPDEGRYECYREALTGYLSKYTIAGHSVFRSGLPVFQDASGKETIPSKADDLERCLASPSFRRIRERVLVWAEDGDVPLPPPPPGRPLDFFAKSIDTYAEAAPDLVARADRLREVSRQPASEHWAEFIGALRARSDLLSPAGRPLSLILAAPVGVRSGADGKAFSTVANLFFGLGGTKSLDEAYAFLRFLALHLYRVNASVLSEIRGQRQAGSSFGHEVKNIAETMTKGWIRPLDDLLDISPEDDVFTSDGKVGRLSIKREYRPLVCEFGFVPVRQVAEDAGQLIALWCMLDNPADIPFDRPPNTSWWTLEQFLERCLGWARRFVMPHMLHRHSAGTVDSLVKLRRVYQAARKVFKLQQLSITGNVAQTAPRIPFNDPAGVWLARAFAAIFKNCVQHGDPLLPIRVELRPGVVGSNSIAVSVENERRRADEQLVEYLTSLSFSPADAEEVVNAFINASAGAKTLEIDDRRFGSAEVAQFCLSKVGGELLDFSEASDNTFRAALTFQAPRQVQP